MKLLSSLVICTLLLAAASIASCQSSSTHESTATTTVKPPQTTSKADGICGNNTKCDDCVAGSSANLKCVWCDDENKCRAALANGFFEIGKVCKGGLWKATWGTCAVSMMALIIGCSVVGGILIISVCCCICCCCCRSSGRQKLKMMKQDMMSMRRAEDRKAVNAERRAERQAKNDEIRKKYGLYKGGSSSYQRMEEDA